MARQTAGPPQWLNSKGFLPLDVAYIAYRQDALRVFRPPDATLRTCRNPDGALALSPHRSRKSPTLSHSERETVEFVDS